MKPPMHPEDIARPLCVGAGTITFVSLLVSIWMPHGGQFVLTALVFVLPTILFGVVWGVNSGK